jgi:hypothetical protein
MKWDVHVNKRVGKEIVTTTHYVDVPNTRSMADVGSVYAYAHKKFGWSFDSMLAVPHRGKYGSHADETVKPWPPEEARHHQGTARRFFTEGHSYRHKGIDADNCGYCALTHGGSEGPNYAGWARLYVEAQRTIPSKWRAAFQEELDSDNKAYSHALRRSIKTFGAPRFA